MARPKKTTQPELLMPDADKVRSLAKKRRNAKKQTSEIAGTIGEVIGKSVEKDHLDRTAFSIACRLDSMSPEKLAITWPHLKRYCEDLEIEKRATEQAEMFEDDEAEAAPDDGKVTRLGSAARAVTERAGA